jgi:protein-arginine kinase activator protein McsA
MCTAKYLSSANQLNEASKHLLNKKQMRTTINQPASQSNNQTTSQSTNQPINQTTALEKPFQLTQTRQVKTSIPSQVSCMNINLTYKVAEF